MSTQHVEFPELTPEADAAMRAGAGSTADIIASFGYRARRSCAAFLREAMKQAGFRSTLVWNENSNTARLFAIANSLHSPPPPPLTLAEAQAADLGTPEGRALVHAFLATLGKGVQP